MVWVKARLVPPGNPGRCNQKQQEWQLSSAEAPPRPGLFPPKLWDPGGQEFVVLPVVFPTPPGPGPSTQ